MKKSANITAGIYQFEFKDDGIAVVKLDRPPDNNDQWLVIRNGDGEANKFCIQGTSPLDICVVPISDSDED